MQVEDFNFSFAWCIRLSSNLNIFCFSHDNWHIFLNTIYTDTTLKCSRYAITLFPSYKYSTRTYVVQFCSCLLRGKTYDVQWPEHLWSYWITLCIIYWIYIPLFLLKMPRANINPFKKVILLRNRFINLDSDFAPLSKVLSTWHFFLPHFLPCI